jgi:sugar/nucleoside kinase (ribokinase family)
MLDVLSIGTATRDVFLTSTSFKVLKDPKHLEKIGFPKGEAACMALGSKLEVGMPVFTTGGGAANSAVSFARQGLRTGAIIKVGEDDSGEAVIESLKNEGVKVFASRSKNDGTAYSTVLITEGGERTILVYRGAGEDVRDRDIPAAALQAKWAYISPGNIPNSVMQKCFATLKKNKTKIAFNPSMAYIKHPGTLKPLLKQADVVFLNREEAALLTDLPYHKGTKILQTFFDMVENGIAVMTEDKNGATACDGNYFYRAGVFPGTKPVDETGAGDAFGAGFVAGLIEKGEVLYALRLASANAASIVESVGASTGALTKKGFKSLRWNEISLDIEER